MRKALFVSGLVLCLAFVLSFLGSRGESAAQSSGPELLIYTVENFTGRAYRVTETILDMPKGVDEGPEEGRYGWNDNVKSLIVYSGTWRLYQHGRFNKKIDKTPIDELTVDAAKAKEASGGWSCLVSANSNGPVQYPVSTSGPWASDISSIELVSEENLPDFAVVVPR